MVEERTYAGIEIVHDEACLYCQSREEEQAELVQRVRNWLAESSLSERIPAYRCRALLALCDEFDPNFPPV
jgi:hypothetical protein